MSSHANSLSRIVSELETNFIVNAGAGTGKTYALVSRVAALVQAGVAMKNIVVITPKQYSPTYNTSLDGKTPDNLGPFS